MARLVCWFMERPKEGTRAINTVERRPLVEALREYNNNDENATWVISTVTEISEEEAKGLEAAISDIDPCAVITWG